MRYFVQELRPEVRKTVLLRQPKTFREAEEMARLACAVETTMSSAPESLMPAQLNNLSQALKLIAVSANQNQPPVPLSDKKNLLGAMNRNNANYPSAIGPIVENLPNFIRSKWEKRVLRYAEDYNDAYPGFKEFAAFIHKRARLKNHQNVLACAQSNNHKRRTRDLRPHPSDTPEEDADPNRVGYYRRKWKRHKKGC